MKLKLDENNSVVVQDGKPVYLKDDGTEVAFDVVGTTTRISQLNAEAKSHREKAESLERTLKNFDGIEDPAAAIAAINITRNLDAKKLVDAGEVEKVRQEAIRALEEKHRPVLDELETLKGEIYREKVGGAFLRSKFIADECAVPADMVEARFAKHFKLEGGTVVGFDAKGEKLYSDSNPGQVASVDEALKMLVNQYAYKDQILKGSQASGGGVNQAGSSSPPKRTYADCKTDAEKVAFMQAQK